MSTDFLLEMARRVSLGVLVLGALLALRMFRAPKNQQQATVSEEQQAALGQQAPAQNDLLNSDGEMNPDLLKQQITSALQENPEEVKRLFLNWVESDQSEA